ncbi:MAG TPA: sigma-54 dependent transcriptional regulator, partial [Gemmatimonadaceae bacterium]|nr:sigma-54 dependent transcriptional regulator [Gemmatimonadaceae bacterium]
SSIVPRPLDRATARQLHHAAMTGADIALDIDVATDGSFRGTCTTYACITQTYDISSCSKSGTADSTAGHLDANRAGWIDLDRVGRSSLTWRAKSAPSSSSSSSQLARRRPLPRRHQALMNRAITPDATEIVRLTANLRYRRRPTQLFAGASIANDHESDPVALDLGDQRYEFADPRMKEVVAELTLMAKTRLPILILGETGVGKEVAARAAHHLSPRRTGPFVSVNCAAIPDGLMGSELFGYQKGAFSGASQTHAGYFECASGGTLFLDEIGELNLDAQVRLLRVLSEHRINRLGSTAEQRVDVRVVAATNRDLDAHVRAGHFREDLYFRLCGATLVVPPLRHRPRDLLRMAHQFLAAGRAELERGEARLSAATLECISRHMWPGNVRELKDAMIYAAAAAGDTVEPFHLPARLSPRSSLARAARIEPQDPVLFRPLREEIDELIALRMRQALDATGGIQSAAAALLQMPRRTFITKMREYGISSSPLRERRALRNRGTSSSC